ncbi:MAG: 30S ribosome-binding factor RbfA [Janthinobacterium lividum]
MAEDRAREHHRNRVQETLREEIGVIIDGELSDPRIGSTTVTEVVLEPGGKSGHVYIAVNGDEAEEDRTLQGLMAARGYIRSELLERLGVRHLPELSFHIDRSEKINARMDTLLTRMKKREGRRTAVKKTNEATKS